jgi:uncharacterized protein (DUF2236 family)
MDAIERFSSDGMLVLGGGRAILLQVADPVVGFAVAEHSDFSQRPLDRLHNTLTFVYAVMLGAAPERELVAGLVNREHAGIPGATDPARQLWVAATLYDTAVTVHDKIYGPVPPAEADSIYDAYSALGTALQVPASMWPSDRAAFASYFAAAAASLEVTEDAQHIAHNLFHPARAPLALRAVLPLADLLTTSLLHPGLRDAYGMVWDARRQRRARSAWRVLSAIARLAPRRLRSWPARHYLRRLRARSASRPSA